VLGDHLIPAPPPFSSVGLELVGAMEKSDRSLPGRRDVRRYGFHGPPHLAMNFFTAPRIYSASPEPPIRPWSTRRRESRRADHFPFDSPTRQKVSTRMDRGCLPEGCGTANSVRRVHSLASARAAMPRSTGVKLREGDERRRRPLELELERQLVTRDYRGTDRTRRAVAGARKRSSRRRCP